jgi:LysM repeat protein
MSTITAQPDARAMVRSNTVRSKTVQSNTVRSTIVRSKMLRPQTVAQQAVARETVRSGIVRSAAMPARTARVHLTRRGRAVLTALAAIPLIVGATVFAFNGGAAIASGEAVSASFSHVTVAAGESLWEIAETVAPAADPRDVVSAIIDLNQLPSSLVVPGQSLAIPAEYAPTVRTH